MASDRIVDISRAHLRAMVAIHRALFDKLLDGDEDPVSHELVALFEDIATTYMEIHATLQELAEEGAQRSKRSRKASKVGGMSESRISLRSHGLASLKTSQSQS
jgi:hypothetical protein